MRPFCRQYELPNPVSAAILFVQAEPAFLRRARGEIMRSKVAQREFADREKREVQHRVEREYG